MDFQDQFVTINIGNISPAIFRLFQVSGKEDNIAQSTRAVLRVQVNCARLINC